MFHILLSKLDYDINYHKKPKNSYFIQFYYHILFKAQEYLCLAIFEKPMIQVHGKTILSMEFKSMIKAHDLNPWQFIYPKPNSHWQHQNPILIGNIKTRFSLATSKPNLRWHYLKNQFSLATSKPNSHWQHQTPILIGNIKVFISNIKAQLTLALFKTQFSLATSKPNSHWQHQSPILIGNIKSPTYVGTI